MKKIKIRNKEFNVEILEYLRNKYKCGYSDYWFLQRVIDEVLSGKEISDKDFYGLKFHYDMEITARKIGIYI